MQFFPRKGATVIAALAVGGAWVLSAAAPVQAQRSVCGDRVVVAFGETLYGIAERCGTSVPAIMAVNPLLPSPNFVFPGMTILMPQAVARPAPVPEMPAGGVVRYVVRPGDTLSSIARTHNVPLAEIYRLNPNVDAASLRIGDVVRLPGVAVVTPPPPGVGAVVRYTVKPGDTLFSIARAQNVPVAEIYRLNPDIDASRLRVGDIVRLPGGIVPPRPNEPGQADAVRYVVKAGDTLSGITKSYGVTLAQIYALNPNVDFQRLQVGDVVRLPAGSKPTQPPAPPSVKISPTRGSPGTVVQVSGTGFPASTSLRLLAGRSAANLRDFRAVTTDDRGRVNVNIRIPDWAAGLRSLVFAFETRDGRLRTVSEPFRVAHEEPAERIAVTGTLTREGAECRAMRGDDGKLYTLAGELRGFRAGDRVRVEGRIAEVSTCMQGTTIQVSRIEEAR